MEHRVPALYIHIPFCRKRCAYCDFLSIPLEGKDDPFSLSSYLKCLMKELSFYRGCRLSTLYIGGGTPSLVDPFEFSVLMDSVSRSYELSHLGEFTLEANPESITISKAKTWISCGVDRISLGAQSFSDTVLARVGRITRSSDTYRSVDLLREAGFYNINIDLILGIQQEDRFKQDLERVVMLDPTHISVYQLSIGENTPIRKMVTTGRFKDLAEEEYEHLYRYAVEFLDCHGYRQYEVSNFAREGYESLHNMGYWMGKDYRGVGLGAVSTFGFLRIRNSINIEKYCTKILDGEKPLKEVEHLSARKKNCERVMLGLRTKSGIDVEKIRSGADEEKSKKIAEFISMLKENGFANHSMNRLVLTTSGFIRSNPIISELLNIIEE